LPESTEAAEALVRLGKQIGLFLIMHNF